MEHPVHTCYFLCIQIRNTFNFGQIITVIEPHLATRWSCISKRGIKYHFFDEIIRAPVFLYPRWCIITFIQIISSCRFGKTVFECKSSCAFVKLGIGWLKCKVACLVVGVGLVGLTLLVGCCTFERGAGTEHTIS